MHASVLAFSQKPSSIPCYNKSLACHHISTLSLKTGKHKCAALPSSQFQIKVMIETLEKMSNRLVSVNHYKSNDETMTDESSLECLHALILLLVLMGLVLLRKLDQ